MSSTCSTSPGDADSETWMIIADPESGTMISRVIALAYLSHLPLSFKETCFGLLAEGDRITVRGFIDAIKNAGVQGLLFRRRWYSISDTRVCADTFSSDGRFRRACKQLRHFNRS